MKQTWLEASIGGGSIGGGSIGRARAASERSTTHVDPLNAVCPKLTMSKSPKRARPSEMKADVALE